jgi:6-phosphogluconolactonase
MLSALGCKSSNSGGDGSNPGSSGDAAANGGGGGAGKPGGAGGSSGSTASGSGQSAGDGGNGGIGTSGGQTGSAAHSGGGATGNSGLGGSGGAGNEAIAGSPGEAAATSGKQIVYVSGYGDDIHVLELDTGAGTLTEKVKLSGGTSPSYMAFSPDKRFAYAINEADPPNSKVLAFKVDQKDGQLSTLNSQVSGGAGSPHLAVHPSGKWLAVAHYTSGEVTVLPIDAEGKLGTASKPDRGPNGDSKNAHQAVFDQTGHHLLVPCLGSNYVLQYVFENGTLKYNDPATVKVEGGPRHLAFDPSEKHAYVLSELQSKITWFDYDKATGKLSNPKTINSYDKQAGSSGHIVVHPNGKWLYASNRQENSLGLFSIAGDATPSPVAFEKDMLAGPRDFSLDPTGKWLILANQQGDQNVLLYAIDETDGKLTRKQVVPNGDKPTFTHALTLP